MSATVGGGTSASPATEAQLLAGDARWARIFTPTPGEIFGLTMSTAGASTTLTVAAGICADSTNTLRMKLTTVRAKTTAAWAVGTGVGGLDTGTIANNTWYHWYVISNAQGSLVDVIFSLSATGPTSMPSGYTLFRRIGSMRTNGSGQWIKFAQVEDTFLWDLPVSDVNNVNFGTTPTLYTLSVPTGINLTALFRAALFNSASGNTSVYLRSPLTATTGGAIGTLHSGAAGATSGAEFRIVTDTSARIYAYNNGAASNQNYIDTYGWVDTRGRLG